MDIRKNPLETLRAVQQFVEHRVQLIDLKGLEDFLMRSRHKVGLMQYSRVLEMTVNVVSVIVNEGLGVSKLHENEEMTEYSFREICWNEF